MNKTLKYYESNANNLVTRYDSAIVYQLHNLLLNIFTKGSYLLELGCGSGRDAYFLYSKGYKVLATDGSKNMINRARELHPDINFKIVQLPDQLNFNDSFDGVYSIATLMHFNKEQIEKIIDKVARILKSKGKFFFSVSIKRDDINDSLLDKNGRYFIELSENEWIDICQKYNLKLIKYSKNSDGLGRKGIVWFNCVVEKDK